jgi:hypothetical protein
MKKSRGLLSILALVLGAVSYSSPAWSDGTVSPGETRNFTQADDGDGTEFHSSLLSSTDCRFIPADSSAEASAVLALGAINYTLTSYCGVFTDFAITSASSGAETVLDATVSAEVEWAGILFGATFLGSGASVTIEMSLIDMSVSPSYGTTMGQIQVISKSQEGAELLGLDVGGTFVGGGRTVSFPGKVVRGHNYAIELRVTCELESGFVGGDLGCIFHTGDPFGLGLADGDRFAKWNKLSITVEQDINERFDILEAKIDALDIKVDALDTKLDEVLRLLHTPPGLRETEVPACEGLACGFPQSPRWRRP